MSLTDIILSISVKCRRKKHDECKNKNKTCECSCHRIILLQKELDEAVL